MPRSFSELRSRLSLPEGFTRDPRYTVRIVLGVLLFANIVAAWAVLRPFGGSAEELEAQALSARSQLQQHQIASQRTKAIVTRIEHARTASDQFLSTYFMGRRTASSTIVSELTKIAKDSGMRAKEHSFTFDPVEGSDTISMMTIVGNYEGTYGDLLQFVNRLDRSPRFLILDSMTALPQQGSNLLNIAIRMNTFVREEGLPLQAAILPGDRQ